ncbi:MAG: phytoene desaturase family protein [Promethearchaeota archaeon]
MTDYDAIIIGSGIGGTAVGLLLASNKFKILLLEKNDFVGGRCSSYEKEGFKVDVGVHSFARSDKGPLHKILKMTGMEQAISWETIKSGDPRWYYKGNFYQFPKDLRKLLPGKDYSDILRLISEATRIRNTNELDAIDLKSWLNQFTDNTLIHSYFNIISQLYFVIPYNLVSTGEFLRCLGSLNKYQSIGYPKGGCIAIPMAYIQGIKKYEGVVETGTTVNKIIIDENLVQGVELDNGKSIYSNIVISNSGFKHTINDLVGKTYFKEGFLKKVDEYKYSFSAITFKLALKKPITSHKIIISFVSENPEERFKNLINGQVPDEIDFFIPVPSNYDPDVAPKGKQLIIAGTVVPKESFQKNKDLWIKNSINTLEKIFPKLSDHLLWYDITTPIDLERMYGKEGSVVGICQNTNQTGSNRPPISLPIKGLYMVGGDAGGWGIGTELAAKSALECSEIILQKRNKNLE